MPHGVVAPEVGLEVVNEGRKRCFASVPCRRNAIVADQVFRVGRVLVRMVRMMRYSLDSVREVVVRDSGATMSCVERGRCWWCDDVAIRRNRGARGG